VASTNTQTFTIKVGGEEIVTSLSDFAVVSAQYAEAWRSSIKLVEMSGTGTTGQLLLKNGVAQPHTHEWGLVGSVPEWADSRLLLLNPNFTLSAK
jgi:hypothetical protein